MWNDRLPLKSQAEHLLVGALALLLIFCTGNKSHAAEGSALIQPELQENFIIVSPQHSYDLNPHTASYSAEAQILTGLYEGLFSYDPITLDPLPALATSYRISRDKKRWTFILREDAKYSNGAPITAQSVRTSWLRLLANPNAVYASLFDIVEGAEAFRKGTGSADGVGIYVSDQTTISIHLKMPAAHLPKLLCMPTFAVISDNPTVYSGPFELEDMDGSHFILSKNTFYYDAQKVPLNHITILLSNDEAENTHGFNTGAVDWLSSTFDTDKLLVKDAVHLYAEFATQYFFFRIRENSIWRIPALRQAALEAVPWEALRANTYVHASTLVYPLNGYPKAQGYEYTDKTEAKLLMKDARKAAGLSENEPLAISFAIPNSDYMKKKAEALKEAWSEIGIALTIVPLPEFEYLSKITETDADLFSYTWIGDFADPLAFLELFRSNSTLNVSNWTNADYDRLLDEAALCTDENHNKLLSSAEQILLEEAVILPIQHPVSINIINLNAVGGWAINAFDIHPLKYLFKKETKDKIPNIVQSEGGATDSLCRYSRQ